MYVRVDVCQARYSIDRSVSFSTNDSRVYIRVFVFMFPNRLLILCNFVDVCGPRKLITNGVSFYVTSSTVSFHKYVCIHEVSRFRT